MSKSFVHLHLHTQYSLLDGAIKIPDLIQRTKEFDMPAVAMTDHGNLFGAVDFYTKAKDAGIKPIIGCELYVAPESRFKKELTKGANLDDPYHHLTVLCENNKGYQNLCALVTKANFEGFYYKPRVDKELLEKYSEGLIILSGCLSSELSTAIAQQQNEKALQLVDWYKDVFADRFYLELQENKIEEQYKVNEALMSFSKEYLIPLVATNDCHYLKQSDAQSQEVLLCVQTGKTLNDEKRMKFGSDEFYLKSAEQMREDFSQVPEACDATLEIADRCQVDFELTKIYLPKYELPQAKSLDLHLKEKALEGLERRLSKRDKKAKDFSVMRSKYEARVQEELEIIQKTGFAGYFLIVADFVNWAQKRDIPVGPGRGSAAGSLVAYCLNITNIDPIPHNLIFERFLNPERVSMPDIDMDFCMNRRQEVIEYVTNKYGEENVAQIITFGKLQAKAAIRDVGRVYGIPYGDVDRISKLVPNVLSITLNEAINQEPKLKELFDNDDRVRQLLTTALALEGSYRHASIHAAGLVISNRPLVETMPLFRGKDGEIVTSFDMKYVEKMGLIKFDFLGLRTLTLIDNVVQQVRKKTKQKFDINEIDFTDKKVYELFSKGDTIGIFQFESSGMRDLLGRLKPARFDDIIAANALYRPGPMMHLDNFVERRHGRVAVNYMLPELKDILQDSYGIIVYQEQVMKIANVLASYSLGEADLLRRAMGKKIVKEMSKQKERFLSGAKANKIDAKKSAEIFDLMARFAEYGFNKSHAQAYAYIAFQTAYLKNYHRVIFMAEMLTMEMENTDKLMLYSRDTRDAGIEILPPDVHRSIYEFSVVGDSIRFGLGAVKNVGKIAIDSIVEARARVKKFESLSHFCEVVDLRKVNRKVLEALIKCGAFDSVDPNRARLMESINQNIESAQTVQQDREMGQSNLFGFEGFSGTQKKQAIETAAIPDWSMKRKLRFEKESTGLYISGHPLNHWTEHLKRLATHTTETLSQATHKSDVRLGGVVGSFREVMTKRGDKMAFLMLEDLTGSVDVVVFSDLYLRVSELLKQDEPLLVTGTAENSQESSKVIATDIEALSDAQKRKTSFVHLDLQAKEVTSEQVQSLKFTLGHHRGSCPVILHMNVKKDGKRVQASIKVGDEMKVEATEALMVDIEKIFNRRVVRFE